MSGAYHKHRSTGSAAAGPPNFQEQKARELPVMPTHSHTALRPETARPPPLLCNPPPPRFQFRKCGGRFISRCATTHPHLGSPHLQLRRPRHSSQLLQTISLDAKQTHPCNGEGEKGVNRNGSLGQRVVSFGHRASHSAKVTVLT